MCRVVSARVVCLSVCVTVCISTYVRVCVCVVKINSGVLISIQSAKHSDEVSTFCLFLSPISVVIITWSSNPQPWYRIHCFWGMVISPKDSNDKEHNSHPFTASTFSRQTANRWTVVCVVRTHRRRRWWRGDFSPGGGPIWPTSRGMLGRLPPAGADIGRQHPLNKFLDYYLHLKYVQICV